MTTIKAVLFDRDDTLSYSDRDVYREAATWVAQRYGLDPREAAAHMVAQWEANVNSWQHLRTVDEETAWWDTYAAELAGRMNLTPAQGREIVTQWPYYRFVKPVPELREVLQELRDLGLKVGVLSNTLPNVWVTLDAIDVRDLVDVALSSCALGVHKPEPDVFRLAARELGLQGPEVLFVDDKLENVLAARAVGMRALLIDHHTGAEDAAHDLRAVLTHVRELVSA